MAELSLESTFLLQALLGVAVAALGISVGLAVVLARGARPARWVVGAVLLVSSAVQISRLRLLDAAALAAPQAGDPWSMWFYDIDALLHLAWVAVFVVIPGRIRWRSPRGILVLAMAALALAGVALWFLDRSLVWKDYPCCRFGDRITLVGRLTLVEGPRLMLLLLVVAAIAELRMRSLEERWSIALLLVGLTAFLFHGAGRFAFEILEDTLRVGDPIATSSFLRGTLGDRYHISIWVWLATVPATIAAAAWIWRTTRSMAALALTGAGVALTLLSRAAPFGWGFLEVDVIFAAVFVMVAVQRRQALGAFDLPPTASRILALLAAASVFLAVNTYTLDFGDQVILAGGMFAGAVLAVVAALAMLPRGRSLMPHAGGLGASGERSLAAYRSALQAEIDAGGDPSSSLEKLRPLRTELDLSDRDHAIVEHTLRGARGSGSAEAELRAGESLLGRYTIERLVGKGGGSQVYLARDERLGRRVALKRLSQDQRRDRAALERFQKETRLASALQHPNVVAVHDIEVVGNEAYLVMEYVTGGSVEERLQAAPLGEPDVRRIAADVLSALQALHDQGIVHRDVKPSNILLDADGRAKLSDFSVARAMVSGETVGFAGVAQSPVGTPAFMAPEQARGLSATPRSDLYSLGATMYAALSGAPPIRVDGLSELEARVRVASESPALPLRGASQSLNAVLSKALARDPSDRYATATDMRRDLAEG